MSTLVFNNKPYSYSWWTPRLKLTGTRELPIGFDLETKKLRPSRQPLEGETEDDLPTCPLDVPPPALGMAFDGEHLVLIHPSKLDAFIQCHSDQSLVGQNIQFDVHVLMKYCKRSTRETLFRMGSENRLADTMVLDLLLQLGTGEYRHGGASGEDTKLYSAGLGLLAAEYGVGELDKTDPFRKRYGELLGLSEEEIEAHPEATGFFNYALKDVLAVRPLYGLMRQDGLELMKRVGWNPDKKSHYEIDPLAVEKFGVLGEFIQVRASISLAHLSRQPLPIDQQRRREFEAAARERYRLCMDILLEYEPKLFKYSKAKWVSKKDEQGKPIKGPDKKVVKECVREAAPLYTAKSLVPQMDNSVLIRRLTEIATAAEVPVPLSEGKLKRVSTSAKAWGRLELDHPFVHSWKALEKEAKLLEFLTALDSETVYSNYNLLMRTGRTSASAHKRNGVNLVPSINIQQIPRTDKDDPTKNVRQCFVCSPENSIYTVDIVYAELRTLAASCVARFGYSKLADTIKRHTAGAGLDPHENAALVVLGMTEAEYRAKPKSEQKEIRQKIKAFSFGVPGGLGARKLVVYAEMNYGHSMSVAEAKESKKAFLRAYPEIEEHLGDHTLEALAYQLRLPLSDMPKWSKSFRYRISRWIKENGRPPKGSKATLHEDYDEDALDDLVEDWDAKLTGTEWKRFWDDITWLVYRAKRAELYADVNSCRLTRRVKNLFLYRACTTQGLIRANCNYSQAANLYMQSSLSCAAKEAIWQLLVKGFDVRMFIHDEIVIHAPERLAEKRAREADEIINKALADTIGEGLPMAVEGAIAPYWKKA